MSNMQVGLILTTKSGDWQGLYVNGLLIAEGHELDDINDWIHWTNKYSLEKVIYKELNDEDDEDVSLGSSFYTHLKGFLGYYG